MESKNSVIVFGRPGCGKTQYMDEIASYLGLRHIVDEWLPGNFLPRFDTLILTSAKPPKFIPPGDNVDWVPFELLKVKIPLNPKSNEQSEP